MITAYAKLLSERSNNITKKSIMDDYLVDRETLSQFVDELIKKKALVVDNVEELNQIRENSIMALDDQISTAVFSSLTQAQIDELNILLDQDESADYEEFFTKYNINIHEIVKNAMQDFANNFLGGQNEES